MLHVIVTLHQRFRQNAQRESTAEGEVSSDPRQILAGRAEHNDRIRRVINHGTDKAAPFYRITELWFDSADQLQQIAATPEWKKIVDDIPNFATGGATVLLSKIE